MTYTLITVTYGGEVSHSRGYETLAMCEQAKSIALTGMTIEENAAADERHEACERDRAVRWREQHPPRKPTTPEDFKLVENHRNFGVIWLASTSPYSTVGEDGLIYDWPGSGSMSMTYRPDQGQGVEYVRGQYVFKDRADIKYAKCVIEP